MDVNTVNAILARAVDLMKTSNNTIEELTWLPPSSGSSDPRGFFVVRYKQPKSGSAQ